ncbi:ribonuclease P protein component [Prosthecochloris sp. N3]|uniref:Ribonuclease P protein component n=1 Tax=Prosthecochloris ethylica TaxID=2743976 RepID=A0ABR9XRC6_9CHLB|nr:ribonuclease P protein component [Prosthecochloris ethylica]MBF0636573.1 ribonuclease P protein component [Prosthecochloris ethylica]MEC9487230.1 ribonuclease P protein component [Prosthecochloris sp.]NUK47205.1 ribonuclease P protein component [Prosthecochloris ethylica]
MNQVIRNTLGKNEILRGRKQIAGLFASGKSFRRGILRILYTSVNRRDDDTLQDAAQVLFVVSKRAVPRATRRNRIRRLMREAYRHEKSSAVACARSLARKSGKSLCMALIYTGRTGTALSVDMLRKEINGLLEDVIRNLDAENDQDCRNAESP